MTREDIIRMAREADLAGEHGRLYAMAETVPETLERFAALVAAAEREACAKASEAQIERWVDDRARYAASECAAAIRAALAEQPTKPQGPETLAEALYRYGTDFISHAASRGIDDIEEAGCLMIEASKKLAEQPAATATYTCGVCGVSMQMEQPAEQMPIAMKTHGAWDGLELLDGLPDGTCLYTAPQPAKPAEQEPVAWSPPAGMKVADIGFVWDGEAQQHTPKAVVYFEPVPANSPANAKGWVDRDAFVAMLNAAPEASQPKPAEQEPVEMSPEFTDTARAALLWVLWHHQGGSSPVGQPIRFALGMGAHDHLNEREIAEAKRWAELTKSTTAEFHAPQPAKPAEQEPYCYVYTENGEEYFAPPTAYVPDNAKPLYTTPQPAAWVGLTDEEIDQAQDSAIIEFRKSRGRISGQQITPSDSFDWWWARAIEAKLKEKNK